jgi:hypothetical protein
VIGFVDKRPAHHHPGSQPEADCPLRSLD